MTDQDLLDIASLIYERWVKESDRLHNVKMEADDGSSDWEMFHTERLINARADENKWFKIKQQFVAEHRELISKAMGL